MARKLKAEAELHAQKVFSNGAKWTPTVTKPQMPNISAANRDRSRSQNESNANSYSTF